MRALFVGLAAFLLIAGCADAGPRSVASSSSFAPAPEPTVDEETGSISGTVVNEEQQPLAGAEVTIPDQEPVKTDEAGSFTINGVAPGTHSVFAIVLGYEQGAKKVDVVAGEVSRLQFVLAAVQIVDAYHESFTKVGVVTGQWTVNYVVNVVNHTTLDNVFCGPCIWLVEFKPGIVDAVTDVMYKPTVTAPMVNEVILMAYNKAGQGEIYSGLASARFAPNGDTHHWSEAQVKNLKGVPKARLQLSGGDADSVGIAFQQRVELWQTWAFGDVLPEDFTMLPPK